MYLDVNTHDDAYVVHMYINVNKHDDVYVVHEHIDVNTRVYICIHSQAFSVPDPTCITTIPGHCRHGVDEQGNN